MSTWNWISSVVSALVGVALFILVVYLLVRSLSPDPFHPIDVFPIIIDTPVVQAGGTLVARDGFCNRNPNQPRIVEIYAFLQPVPTDATRTDGNSQTVDILGTNSEPVIYTLFVCLGTEPVALPVPESTKPGSYTLTTRVVTRGRADQIQREIRTSEVFEVVPATVD